LRVGCFGGLARGGDVGGGFVDETRGEEGFANDLGGFGCGVEALRVGAGELQGVEKSASVLEVNLIGGERVGHFGDGDLDGDAVFEGAEIEDSSAAFEIWASDHGAAIDAVAVMKAAVKVAEDGGLQGDGLALESVGADVAAEFELHGISSGGIPPGC
jgi:hypothetical protein